MRILFLSYSVVGQSNQLRAEALARAVASGGDEVTVVSAPAKAESTTNSVAQRVGNGILRSVTVRAGGLSRIRNSGLSMFEVARRRAVFKGQSFDLVHGFGHRPTVSRVGLAIARSQEIPYVADWSDLFGDGGISSERGPAARATLGLLDGWLEPRVYRRARAVTVISHALRERTRRLNPDAPIARVPPGGLPAAPADARAQVRNQFEIPMDTSVVVHISQNHQDLDLLRETLVRAAAMHDDLRFVLVGPEFPSLAGAPGLESRLHFIGAVPHEQIPGILAAADVAVLPYPPSVKNECRFPCSFSEYAGAGLPIVTQATGDLARLGDAESGALLVEPDGQAMASAIDRIFREPALAASLRSQGLRLAAHTLSWTAGAQLLSNLYRQLTAEPAAARVLVAT